MMIVDWIAGAVPVLLIAWLLRLAVGATAADAKAAIVSVLVAGVIGTLIRSFMEGEGGFAARIAGLFDAKTIVAVGGSTVVALVVIFLWRLRGAGNKT